ncbi:MAG: ribulose-phosphate 3-epimerase, partial [Nitrospira sp.]|nr:ribulose-phosphate 3-epimerase [Nitrospira sp.]
SVHLHRTVQWIKEAGLKAGVSLNPATPIWSLENILPHIDLALLMSVNPGFGGQEFIPQTIEKIKTLKQFIKQKNFSVLIEVDGGINSHNAKDVVSAGTDILVMGSAFFNSKDYKVLMKGLRETLAM